MYYTVINGDTLSSIAKKFNISTKIIAQINCINETDQINTGNILFIPNTTSNFNSDLIKDERLDNQDFLMSKQINISDAYPLPPFYFKELQNYIQTISSVTHIKDDLLCNSNSKSVNQSKTIPESIGIITRYAANDDLASAIRNPATFTHLAYFYCGINDNGSFCEDEIPEVLLNIKKLGVKVFGGFSTLNNFKYSSNFFKFISNEHNNQILSTLSNSINTYDFDGVIFDISLLNTEDFRKTISFVKTLKKEIHGKPVSIMINLDDVSLLNSNTCKDSTIIKDIKETIDFFIVQGLYKNNTANTNFITPSDWFKSKLQETGDILGFDKISLCLGSYGLDMKISDSGEKCELSLLTNEEINLIMSKLGVDTQTLYQDDPCFEYSDPNGNLHIVYFESSFSLEKKLSFAKKSGVSSASLWRLGISNTSILKLFKNF